MSINIVVLSGNLARDPETRSFSSGGSMMELVVTTEKYMKNAENKPMFHRVVVTNEKSVKFLQGKLSKGDKVFVSGELENRKWTDKTGQERTATEVRVGFGGRVEISPRPQQGPQQDYPQQSPRQDYDDEIPF